MDALKVGLLGSNVVPSQGNSLKTEGLTYERKGSGQAKKANPTLKFGQLVEGRHD